MISFLSILSLNTQATGLLDNLDFRTRSYLEAGITIISEVSKPKPISHQNISNNEEVCSLRLEKTRERWLSLSQQGVSLRAVMSFSYRLNRGHIENLSEDLKDLSPSSWDPVASPHLDLKCGQSWSLESSEMIEVSNKYCRRSFYTNSEISYSLLSCASSDQIFLDIDSLIF